MTNGSPSPGWYQDPTDSAAVRWWDGGQWTNNTQPMPGASAPSEPVIEQEVVAQEPTLEPTPEPLAASSEDPWAAAQQAEQQWGQQPEQQWGQQPEQQWGQQPEQQWGQQPEQQWGQQPEQQWGQQPGQQPEQQQWGQQPGGWQQTPQAGWGSTVPPAAVPGGLAPGSPMGQTNVFPTAQTIDPLTGMPVSSGMSEPTATNPKRLAALVVGALLVGLLVIALLWFFLFRGSGTSDGASGPVNVTATYTGTVDPACVDLGAALTADGLTDTVVTRLNDVAIAKDLEDNESYFTQLGSDIEPIMDQYQSACVAAVAAGNAPEFFRTFVETFQTSVRDGATVATTALGAAGQVPPADSERLRAEAETLRAAGQAVMAVTGTPTPTPTVAPSTGVTPAPSVTPSPVPTAIQ